MPDQYDELVPDAQARRELGGVTSMTFHRWDRGITKAPPGWEPPVKIGPRNHRRRQMLEAVKENLFRQAIEARGGKAA
jgi:hypothetical protein